MVRPGNAGYGIGNEGAFSRRLSCARQALVKRGSGALLKGSTQPLHGGLMLRWAAIFLVIAIVAPVFGFGGIAVAAAGIAKILFFVFLILFLVSLIRGLSFRHRV